MRGPGQKELLRSRFIARRDGLSLEEVVRLSARVQRRFVESTWYHSARRLALYSSVRNEVLTDEVFQDAVTSGREVCFPRVVRGQGLSFCRIEEPADLVPGAYDILEPCETAKMTLSADLDLVVVPGVAFDLSGARIGYGKGYYDAALAGVDCPVVGLAYEFQVHNERIPVEAHDVRVSALVTEKEVYEF